MSVTIPVHLFIWHSDYLFVCPSVRLPDCEITKRLFATRNTNQYSYNAWCATKQAWSRKKPLANKFVYEIFISNIYRVLLHTIQAPNILPPRKLPSVAPGPRMAMTDFWLTLTECCIAQVWCATCSFFGGTGVPIMVSSSAKSSLNIVCEHAIFPNER